MRKKTDPCCASKDLEEAFLAAQRGEAGALADIVRLTKNRLFGFCALLTGSRDLAQDICQDTYLKAFQKIGTVRDASGLKAWLVTVARNIYLKHYVNLREQEELSEHEAHLVLAREADPVDHDTLLNLQHLLAELSPDDRSVLLLIHVEGYSHKEAAEIIGISEPAVRVRAHRARKRVLDAAESRVTKEIRRGS